MAGGRAMYQDNNTIDTYTYKQRRLSNVPSDTSDTDRYFRSRADADEVMLTK